MKAERSNVHMTSNVFPVAVKEDKINFDKNLRFVSCVADRKALCKLVEQRHGALGDWRLYKKYARSIPGIREWQVDAIVDADSGPVCEPGDRPWGPVQHGDMIVIECRCRRTGCHYFKQCRPDSERMNANE